MQASEFIAYYDNEFIVAEKIQYISVTIFF